jgi:hypothetical protein
MATVSGKKTLIWVIALVALATFYYSYEIRGGKRRQEAARQESLLLSVRPDEVSGLTLKRAADTIAAVKRQGQWQLTAPLSAPADTRKLDDMVRYMAKLHVLRKIDERPEKLEPFGLADPTLEIRLRRQGPSGAVSVRLGAQNPTGRGYYAQVEGRTAMYLIPSAAKSELDASLYDLRDKTVLAFASSEVREIRLESATEPAVVLQRQDDHWQMTAPVQDRGDAPQIRTLLQRLRDVKAQAFVAETPSDLTPYGLADPALRVSLTVGPDRTVTTLLLGSLDAERKGVYAKRDDAANVVLLPQQFWQDLPTTAMALRDKKLLAFDTSTVQKVQLRYPDTTLMLERQGDTWRLTAPEAHPLQKPRQVDALLYDLSTLEYVRTFSKTAADGAQYGLDPPRVQITVWPENGEPLPPLRIGKTVETDDEARNLVYATVGSKTPLYAIEAKVFDDLPKTPSDLAPPR